MNEIMDDARERRSVMESAGFRLKNESEPGVYVRREEVIRNDPIDWHSEPTELLREGQDRIKHDKSAMEWPSMTEEARTQRRQVPVSHFRSRSLGEVIGPQAISKAFPTLRREQTGHTNQIPKLGDHCIR